MANRYPSAACILFLVLLFSPLRVSATVISTDTTWSGEVSVPEDVFVPEGVTLTIAAGTNLHIIPSETTKTDPEFMSPLTEIIVRGTLVVNGKEGAPVSFALAGEKTLNRNSTWAGIIIDRGKAVINSVIISGAETGAFVIKGSLSMSGSLLTENRYGLTVQGDEAVVSIAKTRVKENDYGVLLLNGARLDSTDSVVQANRKKDTYASSAKDYQPAVRGYDPEKKEAGRIYNDEVILGTVVWPKRVEVRGIIRVPEKSRLIILPGTVVEFRKKDTNNDGIGENGFLIQGVIIAKGTKDDPIIFRSAEKQRRMGDWDAINILNSDGAQNLIEHCQIQDAYRGLHFHFSNVAVNDSVLTNNYRGIQFQESQVTVRGTHFYFNKSALQARDSDIIFSDNIVYRNYSGLNVFRNSIALSGNLIMNNYLEGLRVREGLPVVERNLIDGNRHGITVTGAFYGIYASNVISHNLETGMSIKGADGIEIRGNVIQTNGINGINIQDSTGAIQGNLISDNNERGIGVVSFQGEITANNILKNGLYNLGIDGEGDVSARMNWWGDGDIKATIYDREKDPSKGKAEYLPSMEVPAVFSWPLPAIRTDSAWHGNIRIEGTVTVTSGVKLVLSPRTRVLFSKDSGLVILGKIIAQGEENAVISFSSLQRKGAGEWGEILLDHAVGSMFTYCLFEDATWALHSHFTDLRVERSAFRNNTGGLRFTSGPIEVRRSFFGENEIGIRAFRGNALITENIISGNRTGIFVREKGSGLTIKKNNLYANSDFNIRIGDFNDEDVDARDNWWSTLSPADTIYDARTEPGIGNVLYEPFAQKAFEIKVPVPMSSQGQGTGSDRTRIKQGQEGQ